MHRKLFVSFQRVFNYRCVKMHGTSFTTHLSVVFPEVSWAARKTIVCVEIGIKFCCHVLYWCYGNVSNFKFMLLHNSSNYNSRPFSDKKTNVNIQSTIFIQSICAASLNCAKLQYSLKDFIFVSVNDLIVPHPWIVPLSDTIFFVNTYHQCFHSYFKYTYINIHLNLSKKYSWWAWMATRQLKFQILFSKLILYLSGVACSN